MKTALGLIVCAGLMATTLASASTQERDIEELRAGSAHRDLYAMAVNADNQDSVIAVGGFGAMVTSKDGGETWEAEKLDTDMALLDIVMVGEHQIIVGQSGLVMIRDGDEAWETVEVDTDARLLAVGANQDGLVFTVGQFGVVLRSRDGGKNWQELKLNLADKIEGGYDPHLYDVHVADDGVATVVGEFGLIMRTTDDGANWSIVNKADESLFALQMRDDGAGFAVGQSGVIFRTENNGENWSRLDNKLDANLLGVWSDPDGTVTAPGFRHMLVSDDNGETWLQVENQDVNRGWYIDASVVDGKPGVLAVGYHGKIIKITKAAN